jgi:hypothetical protein
MKGFGSGSVQNNNGSGAGWPKTSGSRRKMATDPDPYKNNNGSGAVQNYDGSGSGWPKNKDPDPYKIITDPDPQHCLLETFSELLAACRTCGALTGIDLSGCTKWTNFIQIHYRRQETSTKPARYYIYIWSSPPPLLLCREETDSYVR